MLTKRGQWSHAVREHAERYDNLDYDNDYDYDNDRQQTRPVRPIKQPEHS